MILPLLLLLTFSTSPKALLESASTQLTSSNWKEAADSLDQYVRLEKFPTPEVLYDQGVAHYNLGEYDIAAKSFDSAMATSTDTTLKTYSAFNLGNSIYQQTLHALEGTGTEAPSDEDIIAIEDAKSQISQALASYRSAIAHDSSDMDARANGELAWSMLQQLDQMQEQMEEEQKKQQQDDQQEQEQNEDSADQQKEDQEQKDDGSSEEQQDKQDGEKSEDSKDGSEPKQGEQKDDSGEQQNDSKDSQEKQDKQDSENNDNSKEQSESQEGKQDLQDKNQNESQEGSEEQQNQQEIPDDGDLQTNSEEMNASKSKPTNIKDEGERLSENEANRLLQLIRDKEQKRRKALAARRAANRIPVEKDW